MVAELSVLDHGDPGALMAFDVVRLRGGRLLDAVEPLEGVAPVAERLVPRLAAAAQVIRRRMRERVLRLPGQRLASFRPDDMTRTNPHIARDLVRPVSDDFDLRFGWVHRSPPASSALG
jgi:hypothetical protein